MWLLFRMILKIPKDYAPLLTFVKNNNIPAIEPLAYSTQFQTF